VKTKILIIHDSSDYIDIATQSMQMYWPATQVLSADTAAEGLELWKANPDIEYALLDMHVGEVSAGKILKAYRHDIRTAEHKKNFVGAIIDTGNPPEALVRAHAITSGGLHNNALESYAQDEEDVMKSGIAFRVNSPEHKRQYRMSTKKDEDPKSPFFGMPVPHSVLLSSLEPLMLDMKAAKELRRPATAPDAETPPTP